MSAFRVRDLTVADTAVSAELHTAVLHMEFIARCGPEFVRRYQRAWVEAPGGLALAAVDESGAILGVLLGAVDPAAHTSAMVRGHGLALAARLAAAAARRPHLAKEMLATRTLRYARGTWRVAAVALARWACRQDRRGTGTAGQGEVTHLLVEVSSRGVGVGRALLDAAEDRARQAGLGELVLVTPPELRAVGFYERLGWTRVGELTSRSGEPFVLYRLPLA